MAGDGRSSVFERGSGADEITGGLGRDELLHGAGGDSLRSSLRQPHIEPWHWLDWCVYKQYR
jgi:hypothetical protein